MTSDELERLWGSVCSDLSHAKALLPQQVVDREGSSARFDEYLDHNELELALDELEALGRDNNSASAFWLYLRAAADRMGLHESVRRIDGILASLPRP